LPAALLLLVALASHFLGGCTASLQSAPTTAVLAQPTVTLPTRRCANYFLVQTSLNGKGPFWMVLDTGASQTVVSPRIADQLKDDARPVNLYAEGSQGQRQDVSHIVTIRELKIGDATLSGLEAITLDLSRIQATLGANVDGILGYPAFADVI